MKAQRIWATFGLVLMVVSLVCMIVGMFTGAAKELMMQIALLSFLGAAGVLLGLKGLQKRQENQESEKQE